MSATGVLCNRKIRLKLKIKFYCRVVRPVILYGRECWLIKKVQVRKLLVAEMGMPRWICDYTLLYRVWNEDNQDKVAVVSIKEKLMEARLRWLGDVKRRDLSVLVRRCLRIREWVSKGM